MYIEDPRRILIPGTVLVRVESLFPPFFYHQCTTSLKNRYIFLCVEDIIDDRSKYVRCIDIIVYIT